MGMDTCVKVRWHYSLLLIWLNLGRAKETHGLVTAAKPMLKTGRQLLTTAHIWYQTPGHSLKSHVQPPFLNKLTRLAKLVVKRAMVT